MKIRNSIQATTDEFAAYRRDLHQNPQTAFEEEYASAFIAQKLTEWGVPFVKGVGHTGIVATIKGQTTQSGKAIGIRADIDALDIFEEPNKDWMSLIEGKMHGCGHDGHTTILLNTAKYLNENNNFDGTLHLIFQPAEENGEGANAMLADGFLDRFPCDALYAMHNWPYAPLGYFEINEGASMASVDFFEITVEGKGGHASKPHTFVDPIMVSAAIISGLQTIVSRETDPFEPIVLSVTNIHGGTGAFNVNPAKVIFSGTVRTYCQSLRKQTEKRIKEMSSEIASSYRARANCTYENRTEPTINDPVHAKICTKVAQDLVGDLMVITDAKPSMGGEDFGAFLYHVPGAYVKIGQGVINDPEHRCSKGLHNAGYDFNDDLIPIATEYWARLVEHTMPLK
tara:strand:+ start:9084 stop:10277 length:1194 start_codon:yes stop_codon:yes gene_type:complete